MSGRAEPLTAELVETLRASEPTAGAAFGESVALSGRTLAVGSPGAPAGEADEAGTVVVFVRAAGEAGWTEESVLEMSPATGDQLGGAVDVTGGTVVAGAADASDAGRVGVFPAWGEASPLTVEGASAGEALGSSVAIDEGTVVAGAPGADPASQDRAGAAYVFVRSGATWTMETRLEAAEPRTDDELGSSVAVRGDLAVVGLPRANDFALPGVVLAFARVDGVWSLAGDPIGAESSEPRDAFGRSVAFDGETLVVGAPGASDDEGAATGRAYVFAREADAWTLQAALAPSSGAPGAGFGQSSAVSGHRVVIGAPSDASDGAQTGAVYVFQRDAEGAWPETARLVASEPSDGERFGADVALEAGTAVVGAPGNDVEGDDAGAAYVFALGCSSDADCIDRDRCTIDTCDTSTGLCEHVTDESCVIGDDAGADAGPADAGSDAGEPEPDAATGDPDGGMPPAPSSSGCRALGPAGVPHGAMGSFIVLAAALALRRRRR